MREDKLRMREVPINCDPNFPKKFRISSLTIHRKRMHKVSKLKQTFSCNKCGKRFQQEANLLNHRKFAQECSGELVGQKVCG